MDLQTREMEHRDCVNQTTQGGTLPPDDEFLGRSLFSVRECPIKKERGWTNQPDLAPFQKFNSERFP
tara:strand:- start:150 stop:350 length:201 start_codon:yes stop_codon:yes gene_type:complete